MRVAVYIYIYTCMSLAPKQGYIYRLALGCTNYRLGRDYEVAQGLRLEQIFATSSRVDVGLRNVGVAGCRSSAPASLIIAGAACLS